jgi:hypothetical protein
MIKSQPSDWKVDIRKVDLDEVCQEPYETRMSDKIQGVILLRCCVCAHEFPRSNRGPCNKFFGILLYSVQVEIYQTGLRSRGLSGIFSHLIFDY